MESNNNNLYRHKSIIGDYRQIHTIVFDFDGVFTDNKVYVDENGIESVRCDRSDSYGIRLLHSFAKQNGWDINFFVLTTEENSVVTMRAKKIKINCVSGIDNKLNYLIKYFDEFHKGNLNPFEGLIYVGNDINDFPAMSRARISIAPSDAHAKIIEIATIVYDKAGGCGFVRSVIEDIIGIKSFSHGEVYELISNC